MKRVGILCCVVVFVSGAVGAGSMSAIQVGDRADVVHQQQLAEQLQARLMKQRVEAGLENPLRVTLTAEQRKGLENGTRWPLRVGVVAPVAEIMRFGTKKQAYGATRQQRGLTVWTGPVQADGATGIRLHITGLDLPRGVELAFFNEHNAFAYTGRGPHNTGDFWTHTMAGGVAFLQLSGSDLSGVSFEIADLGYMDDPISLPMAVNCDRNPNHPQCQGSGGESNLCSYNAECVENAGCTSSSVVADAVNAVGHMRYVDGQYMYVCSGGLIANDAGRTYFLTANHCISTNAVASSLETYFFYTIGCNDTCDAQWTEPSTPRALGASLVATSETSDYTLLELDEAAPAGTVMLGWDATPIADANGTMLYRIAHPSGAPQAYSEHEVENSYGDCGGSWEIPNWIYSQDVTGATEGGSSGSPVLNGAGQIVGQLSGGCGTNINDTCDTTNNRTVDGAFAAYYDDISSLLGTPTYTDADGDTFFAEVDDCNDNDADINPDATEICEGLIDENCDGNIDEGCGGSCLPRGDPCTLNSECCSGKCHLRKLTCN